MTHDMKHTSRAALAALALIAALGVAGCNTLRGAGEDLQEGGEALEGAATQTQEDLKDGNPTTP